MDQIRDTKLEVNTKNIIYNINQIKKFIGKDVDIMPIIKNNAYGTYIDDKLQIFEKTNIKIVGVAIVDEGIYLREKGFKGDILILNQPFSDEIETIAKYNLICGISSIEFLEKMGKSKYEFKVHVEIGTGMGRTGINPNRFEKYMNKIKEYKNIKIDGIYTHFACSDSDVEYTKMQIYYFNKVVDIAKKELKELRYIHCCNSAGILNFKEAHFNLVRPGILIYGYLPNQNLKDKINVLPSLRLKSKISFLKEAEVGVGISYNKTFVTSRKTIVATIPIGYADGVRRSLSNKGYVVIKGKLAPIIGTVCMDAFMVDVTDIENVKTGDEVFIWDNDKIKIEDIAKNYDTINYEVIATISKRVVREYI